MKPFLYTSKEKKAIETLLSRAVNPAAAMNAEEFHGFCSGLAILPEIVRMQEWMPEAFGEEQLVFEGEADAQKLMGDLFAFQNRLNAAQNEGKLEFPFDPAALKTGDLWRIEDWTYGFYHAMNLRPEVWGVGDGQANEDDESPDEVTDVSSAWGVIMAMAYPERIAEIFDKESFDLKANKDDMEFYVKLLLLLPLAVDVIRNHAAAQPKTFPGGMPFPSRLTQPASSKIGRNDSCPCGSGKKYKKCCGMN
ncbi:MAG TPA: UPF0149 family protein [Dissulfurispiraceae bacterium]|nr:UPF0149 family protein [Dissulfurispiraceae bacterium]